MGMDAQNRYVSWLQDPLIDQNTKEELQILVNDKEEIEDRFFRWISFGTGGLRGTIGAGTNRMNVYTVRLATQALANNLISQDKASGGVAIAHDSRHMSREFTEAAASVLVGNGIPVYVFSDLAPTPLLSYAVRHYGASAGIVITASHNPSEYNGYKVYNEQGNQILNDESLSISSQMSKLGLNNVQVAVNPKEDPLWTWLGEEVIASYYGQLMKIAPKVEGIQDLRVLYTPLHGTGARFVPEMLRKAGFSFVDTVEEQMVPDGDFPTIKYPNPEEPEAFELSFAKAENSSYDLIMATDPDADRMGVAVKHNGEWILLNGNQVGILLTDFILSNTKQEELSRSVVIKTIVSTDMVEPIAQKYGVEVRNTLTGFKYIGALIDELPKENKAFIFGFEESYGYLAGTAVRDKDAVLASLLVAQVAAYYKQKDLTLVDRLEELLEEYGYYLQDLVSYTFATSLEAERSREFIKELERTPISKVSEEEVVEVLNYGQGKAFNLKTKKERVLELPKERVLQWVTAGKSKITLRPSGTEPKMKLYLEVVANSAEEAQNKLVSLRTALDTMIKQGLNK